MMVGLSRVISSPAAVRTRAAARPILRGGDTHALGELVHGGHAGHHRAQFGDQASRLLGLGG